MTSSRSARAFSASDVAPSSSTQATRKPARSMWTEELDERFPVGLLGAVVVEVVGLDVRDDRAVRRVDEEGAVALVGLGDEDAARAVVGVRAGLVELPADRERRVGGAVLQRDGQQRGRGGLAVRPGDGDDLPALHHRLERGRSRQQPQPEPLSPRRPPGCPRARRSRRRPCRRPPPGRRRARRRSARRAPGAPSRARDCRASLPLTLMPRASMMRAMPDSPAPPMPTKWTRPSWSAGSSSSGTGTLTTLPSPRR